VNRPLVGGAAYVLRNEVECKADYLSFICAASQLLDLLAIFCGEDADDLALVRSGGEERPVVVEGHN
jgi:hypothetical protein